MGSFGKRNVSKNVLYDQEIIKLAPVMQLKPLLNP